MAWKCHGKTNTNKRGCGHTNSDNNEICLNCGIFRRDLNLLEIKARKPVIKQLTKQVKNRSEIPNQDKANKQKFLTKVGILAFIFIGFTGFLGVQAINKMFQTREVPERTEPNIATGVSNPLDNIEWSNYQNPKYPIALKYDRSWKKDETTKIMTGEVVSFYPRKTSPNNNDLTTIENVKFTVTIDAINNKMSLEEYGQYLLQQIDEQSSRNVIVTNNILNNQKAKQISFSTIDGDDNKIKRRSIWVLDDYNAYRIDYIAEESEFAQYQPIVEEMINSFKIN